MILVVNGVKFYKSGREVCDLKTAAGRREYKRRILEMLYRQGGNCKCGKYLNPDEATFDHEHGRGHGGGNRDDRILINGKPVNAAMHSWCNVEKGSKRGYDSLAQ